MRCADSNEMYQHVHVCVCACVCVHVCVCVCVRVMYGLTEAGQGLAPHQHLACPGLPVWSLHSPAGTHTHTVEH